MSANGCRLDWGSRLEGEEGDEREMVKRMKALFHLPSITTLKSSNSNLCEIVS